MTSQELFEKLKPSKTETFEGYYREGYGLEVNFSDIFCQLIKDAARTNRFQSDVYYDLKEIEKALNEYDPDEPPDPIWVAFRKDGVDGTSFLINAREQMNSNLYLSNRYFMIYSVSFRKENSKYGRRYYVDFNTYWV